MKLWNRLFGRKAAELTYDQIAGLIDGTGSGVFAGMAVTDKTALQVATVLACVRVIADGCATPKLRVFRDKGGTREEATNIPEHRLLSRRPNEWQTSFEWRRTMTLHAALTGNALSIKARHDNGRVSELLPVMPGRWSCERVSRYDVLYRCFDEFGMIGEFGPRDVFHLPGLQWDFFKGMNAVTLARNAVGLSMATDKSMESLHTNGMRPGGTYSVTGVLNADQHKRLTETLKRNNVGAQKAGAPLVLDRDAKWLQTAMTGVDAQHNETRRTQIEEICRSYGVFPIMVGHGDKSATFASSEAFFGAHLRHTLAPWHQAWTQRLDEMLLDGSGPLFCEFDTRYLLAGSMKDRAVWARTMAETGIYTRNEIRDEDGKDPLPGLDEPLTPMNMGKQKDEEPPTD